MLKRLYFIICLLFVALVTSCTTGTDELSPNNNSNNTDGLFHESLQDYSPFFKAIIRSDSGIIRGVNWGMSADEIRGLENAELDETGDDHVFYTLDFDITENIDLQYYFTKNKLSEVKITAYTSDVQAREDLFNEFIRYYDDELGKHTSDTSGAYWNNLQRIDLSILKVGTPKFPNLEISFKNHK